MRWYTTGTAMKQFFVKVIRLFSCIAVCGGAFVLSSDLFTKKTIQPSLDALGIDGGGPTFGLTFFLSYFIVPILVIAFTGARPNPVSLNSASGNESVLSQKSNMKHNAIVIVSLILFGFLLGFVESKLLFFSALGSH